MAVRSSFPLARWTLGLALVVAAWPALAQQDPPATVGRLAWSSGAVSLAPAGGADWVQAPLNRPLVPGDRLWTAAGARDEAQFGNAIARMDGATLMTVLGAGEGALQLQLSQGRIDLHVRRLAPGETVEVDTPTIAFVARAPGDYRIAVTPDGAATDATVLRGAADAYGDGTTLALAPGQGYRFAGPDVGRYTTLAGAPDDFDRWAMARDARLDRALAPRYVPAGVVGVEDLDDYGTWRNVPDYGMAWVPTRAPQGWAPYHDGHWSWIEPWGWTWIDDQPWGYAVSHYGRWSRVGPDWAWVPAPAQARPVYAPALVAFVGTALAVGAWSGPGVGWFPLAPREPYRPPYHASPAYVTRVNVGNTMFRGDVARAVNDAATFRYRNRDVPGALVALPGPQFAQGVPTRRGGVVLPPRVAGAAPFLGAPGVRPDPHARFGAGPAAGRPPAPVAGRGAVARALPAGAFAHPGQGAPALAGRAGPDRGGVMPPLRVLRPASAGAQHGPGVAVPPGVAQGPGRPAMPAGAGPAQVRAGQPAFEGRPGQAGAPALPGGRPGQGGGQGLMAMPGHGAPVAAGPGRDPSGASATRVPGQAPGAMGPAGHDMRAGQAGGPARGVLPGEPDPSRRAAQAALPGQPQGTGQMHGGHAQGGDARAGAPQAPVPGQEHAAGRPTPAAAHPAHTAQPAPQREAPHAEASHREAAHRDPAHGGAPQPAVHAGAANGRAHTEAPRPEAHGQAHPAQAHAAPHPEPHVQLHPEPHPAPRPEPHAQPHPEPHPQAAQHPAPPQPAHHQDAPQHAQAHPANHGGDHPGEHH